MKDPRSRASAQHRKCYTTLLSPTMPIVIKHRAVPNPHRREHVDQLITAMIVYAVAHEDHSEGVKTKRDLATSKARHRKMRTTPILDDDKSD